MDLSIHLAGIKKLASALQKLTATKKPLLGEHLSDALLKASASARSLNLEDLQAELKARRTANEESLQSALRSRREMLHDAAEKAAIPHSRRNDYDWVCPFKVTYKRQKIRLFIGSETAADFEEADGDRLFERIVAAARELEQSSFERGEFFKLIKDSIAVARIYNPSVDGWTMVRDLYKYVALLRNLKFTDFVANPSAKNFKSYSSAQFAYDLARFGRDGWIFENAQLRGESPNMKTAAAGQAITLPNLAAADGNGSQFARLRIDVRVDHERA